MKTILITGANKGIGLEIAGQCSAQNHHVILSGRNEIKLQQAKEKLNSGNVSIGVLLMDVSDPESVSEAARKFSARFASLDVVVNNAGIIVKGDHSLASGDEQAFNETINTNAHGPLRVARAFIPLMQKGGHIINISSGGGSMTDPVGGWSPAYCASKTLLNAITRHLAYELTSAGIRVNALCPGWVKTDMGGEGASRPVSKGAETPVWLINDGAGNATGKFFRDKKEIPW
jgi:NAD(P)-dependent dehydrogenase (short-subunit alcohol dehydrogenase family)